MITIVYSQLKYINDEMDGDELFNQQPINAQIHVQLIVLKTIGDDAYPAITNQPLGIIFPLKGKKKRL